MKHWIGELRGDVDDERRMLNVLLEACQAAKATVLRYTSHHFHPRGFSAVVILAESHAAIHTWPEERKALVDYFSCSMNPRMGDFEKALIEEGFTIERSQVVER
jgi:S-adenosylmethionine decarboxylase proenzyme